jgi:hypothetical protein
MILTENKENFKEFEKNIFKEVCKQGCKIIKEFLESYDKEIKKERNKAEYRDKGKRKTVFKTMMGEVEFSRTVYEHIEENGEKSYIYLLDKELGLDTYGKMSSVLAEKIAESVCLMPYRKTADTISEITGQSISHTGVWNVTQTLGENIDNRENEMAAIAKAGKGKGQISRKVLFEEQDGIYLKMQGESRKKLGESYEMKLAIGYDGAKKTGKDRFELTNKVACASFEGIDKFYKRKEGVIANYYNVDEIEMRILNGDGASWIKRSINGDTHYQLDTFHRNKAITTYVKNIEARRNIFKLLNNKEVELCLDVIEAYANSAEDINEKDNFKILLKYFKNNKKGLIGYKDRGINIPNPEESIHYRTCGAMESNIFTIIGNRMKGRRMCWSEEGGNNLAKLLCLKHTRGLSKTVTAIATMTLSEKYSEETIKVLSSAEVPLNEGKGWNGYMKFNSSSIPSSMKWIKDIFSLKNQINYIG